MSDEAYKQWGMWQKKSDDLAAENRTLRSRAADDPEMDGTDFAHPAWWRGQADGVEKVAVQLGIALDGLDDGGGVLAHPGIERVRRWILEHR